MWTANPATDRYRARRSFYAKKHWRELENLDLNLAEYLAALELNKPMQIRRFYSFVHEGYPEGIYSIDQRRKGSAGNLAETRLYVYPEVEVTILHLLTIGDKNTQKDDVQFCKECVQSLNTERLKTNEPAHHQHRDESTTDEGQDYDEKAL